MKSVFCLLLNLLDPNPHILLKPTAQINKIFRRNRPTLQSRALVLILAHIRVHPYPRTMRLINHYVFRQAIKQCVGNQLREPVINTSHQRPRRYILSKTPDRLNLHQTHLRIIGHNRLLGLASPLMRHLSNHRLLEGASIKMHRPSPLRHSITPSHLPNRAPRSSTASALLFRATTVSSPRGKPVPSSQSRSASTRRTTCHQVRLLNQPRN